MLSVLFSPRSTQCHVLEQESGGVFESKLTALKFGPVICFFNSQNKQLLALVFLFTLNSPP